MGITNTALFEFNNILEEEYVDKEVFDKPGEFWYFTKHGIGPGSVPKDINIEKIIEGDGGEYFLVKDKILSTSALNKYEIKEKIPKNIDEEYSLVGQDGNAFSLMGYTARCMRKCGFKKADIDEMRERAMSGDYNNLIVVCDEYIQKCNDTLDYDDLTEGVPSGIPNEPVIPTEEDVESMSFDELLSFWWDMNGMAACYDMQMEPDEIDKYWKDNPEELLYTVKEGLPYNESLNENLQDTFDKIIDNYNYYKNRNNAGLMSIKEDGLKAFEEFSIKYPNLKQALQSKIKDDFKKDLVKSNMGLAIQSVGLLNESYKLNESMYRGLKIYKDDNDLYCAKKGEIVVEDNFKNIKSIKAAIDKELDTWGNDAYPVDDLTESYHSFNWHGQVKISVHDNDPKWPDEYVCQVSEIHPYDDADYAWAKKDSPVSAKIIQSNKVIDTIQLPEWDDDSFEDENEYYNDVIDMMARAIRKINKNVESKIIHN